MTFGPTGCQRHGPPAGLPVGIQFLNQLIDKFGHALRVQLICYQLTKLLPLFFFFICHGKSKGKRITKRAAQELGLQIIRNIPILGPAVPTRCPALIPFCPMFEQIKSEQKVFPDVIAIVPSRSLDTTICRSN
jgi:hypothetical protein